MSGFLCVPREVWEWDRQDWARCYVDLQFRAAWAAREVTSNGRRVLIQPGEVLFSVREAARWWGWGEKAVRVFVEHLEAQGLVAYPEGKEHRRLFRLALPDYWGAKKGASGGASKGAKKSRSTNDLGGTGAQGKAQGGAQAGAQYKEDELEDEKKITTTVPSEPAGQPAESRPVLSLVRVERQPAARDEPERIRSNDLLAEWIKRQKIRVSEREKGKQAAAAVRICSEHTRAEINAAWWGLTHQWPWAAAPVGEGRGWDLMTLEREFVRAADFALENHPEIKKQRQEAEFEARLHDLQHASGW
jgi:hypothetical protein